MKRATFLIGSACWLLFAVGFGVLLARYLVEGAGLQFSARLFWSSSVLIGSVHVVGLIAATVLCFAVSAGFWVHAFVHAEPQPTDSELDKREPRPTNGCTEPGDSALVAGRRQVAPGR
ncbi:MAG: hypothetical protein AB9869_03450 [Verrucomicrobiia bacterium]